MGRAFEYRRAAKEKRWDKMSKLFPKLGKAITMAAKAGVPDPEMNAALRTAIINAKSENMPKDKIEAAVKRAAGKDAANFEQINYEGKGPHGVLVFVECATDNSTRTVANVRSFFNKYDGAMVPTGSLEYMFNRKAVFEFALPEGKDPDEIELELIDYGVESIEKAANEEDEDEDEPSNSYFAYSDYKSFGDMSSGFEKIDIEVSKACLKRFPTTPINLDDTELLDVEKLLDKLEDDEDVQAVYTNIE
ncbi:MAG: YebC/PmpR family DNA-binding regulatory protein [Limisphaerales bacterium]|jgi:YebC/PmpR family DNA-binding regulatory protein